MPTPVPQRAHSWRPGHPGPEPPEDAPNCVARRAWVLHTRHQRPRPCPQCQHRARANAHRVGCRLHHISGSPGQFFSMGSCTGIQGVTVAASCARDSTRPADILGVYRHPHVRLGNNPPGAWASRGVPFVPCCRAPSTCRGLGSGYTLAASASGSPARSRRCGRMV